VLVGDELAAATFAKKNAERRVLLIQRNGDPFTSHDWLTALTALIAFRDGDESGDNLGKRSNGTSRINECHGSPPNSSPQISRNY
jgi:hypothetical protein